mmetsp:Transcript_18064/g.26307  ORF Transcript_18064/g.26307 Transcript_18064/m.26307 type:complete len:181 (-) Transcript_18064:641-1183(-)
MISYWHRILPYFLFSLCIIFSGCVDRSVEPLGPSYWHEDGIQMDGTKCPAGMYRKDNWCYCCPRGSYGDSNELTAASQCTSCPAGTYRDTDCGRVVEDCLPCPAGTYGSSTRLTSPYCTGFCPDGMYSYEDGQSDISKCKGCPELYFNWQCKLNRAQKQIQWKFKTSAHVEKRPAKLDGL